MTGDMHEHAAAGEAAHTQDGPRAFFRPKPDGEADPAGEAGWYLERERERRGLSLQTVSRATGVHPQHLRAIELGMLENLPERSEALRMIGAYARFLGFDPQPLVAHFEACLPAEKREKAFSSARIIPFPLIERLRDFSRTPAGMGAAVLTAVMLFGGMGWALWPASSPAPSTRVVAEAPQAPQAPSSASKDKERAIAATSGKRADAPAATSPRKVAKATNARKAHDPIGALIARTMQNVEEPNVEESVAPAAAKRAATPRHPAAAPKVVKSARRMPLPPAPAGKAAAPTPRVADNGPALDPQAVRPLAQVPAKGLALRAAEQIWLRLEDDNGLPWFVGFLKAGQSLALPSERPLRLSASDVHRLEWYVNGQRMGRLGKRGADMLSEPLDQLYRQSGLKVPGAAGKQDTTG